MAIETINRLQEEIDYKIADIKSDAMSMSIGELVSLYQGKELIIQPEFQRLYRWNIEQKSRLIESILLGIPLPAIFVFQNDDSGVWQVIDGLQRLSTIFEFMGILEGYEPLQLVGTEYLPSLEGKVWSEDFATDKNQAFTMAQRMFVKRARIDVKIILRQSDKNAQYEIFQRLNTGGTALTEAEIRNAILLMENPEFHTWLTELSEVESFKELVTQVISDAEQLQQYDKELVIRLLIFKNKEAESLKKIRSFKDFINIESVKIAQTQAIDYKKEKNEFVILFDTLQAALADDAFRRFNVKKNKFEGRFAVYAYEIITMGLLPHLNQLQKYSAQEVKQMIIQMWKQADSEIYELRAGKNLNMRIYNTIVFGRNYFDNIFKD
ncbi:MAG: DUF262 domain-containing protein [Bernardetiaceae bacterium]|nr:DUF262 domain-containing protein [Bernardetiaceae bacterium]